MQPAAAASDDLQTLRYLRQREDLFGLNVDHFSALERTT